MTEHVPAGLEAAVKADLHAVTPLPSPGRRALRLSPLAALTLVAAPVVFALRGDAPMLGWILTWGASIAQAVLALAVLALGLREAIPGRHTTMGWLLFVVASVLAFSMVATLRTWELSPTMILPGVVAWVGSICFMGTIITAFPMLAVAAALAARGMATRPWVSGGLCGLAAGLVADAGWRLFCHYSDPLHVVPTHTGGVLAVALMGAVASAIAARSAPSAPGRARS